MANEEQQKLQLSLVADYLLQNGLHQSLKELIAQVTAAMRIAHLDTMCNAQYGLQTPDGIEVLSRDGILSSLRLSKLAGKRKLSLQV